MKKSKDKDCDWTAKYKAVIIGKSSEIDPVLSVTINNGYGDYEILIEDWEKLRIRLIK